MSKKKNTRNVGRRLSSKEAAELSAWTLSKENHREAAEELGISSSTLNRMIARKNIRHLTITSVLAHIGEKEEEEETKKKEEKPKPPILVRLSLIEGRLAALDNKIDRLLRALGIEP